MQKASECKLIRFIDPDYNDLFYLLDGESIDIIYKNGERKQHKCQYLDEAHVKVGHNDLHICQLAEMMVNNGHSCKPVYPLEEISLKAISLHQRELFASRKAMREAFWSWRFIIRDEWDGEKNIPRVSMKWADIHAEKASVKRLCESVQVANRLRACLLTSVQKVTEFCTQRKYSKPYPDESFYDFVASSHSSVHYIRIHIDRQVVVTVYCCRRSEMDKRQDLVAHHAKNLLKDKFTIDHENGLATNEYYNPDSSAGGELVCNKMSFAEIADIARKTSDEESFWDCFDGAAEQTYTSITDKDFREAVMTFVNAPADFRWRDTTTTKALIALAMDYTKSQKTE